MLKQPDITSMTWLHSVQPAQVDCMHIIVTEVTIQNAWPPWIYMEVE